MQKNSPHNVLIIGANSAIAEATSLIFARQGCHLYLVGRTKEKLNILSEKLITAGASHVDQKIADINDFDNHELLLKKSWDSLKTIDLLFIAHGTLSDQTACKDNFEKTKKELNTNLLSVISLLTAAASRFEKQKSGAIAVISSVAGDRGRQSNYIYGTAKGALDIFLQGLRNRLHANKVQVLTIKPGFVRTTMTAHLQQGLLYSDPEFVAKDIFKAIQSQKDVLYTPWFWRWIMLIMQIIPETLFKRLKL